MAMALAGLALASCHDEGAGPIAYCEERFSASPDELACSAHYLICKGEFGCSWRVDCTPNDRGTTTCTCTEAPAQDCHLGATWEVERDFCTLPETGEREAFRDAVVVGCVGEDDSSNVDFSRLP
jgi:hypothetical protein